MILKARNIVKTYTGAVPTQVLKGVSLDVAAGESVAIMGKSGEGKSTLLTILGTLEEPTSGTLEICGSLPPKSDIPLLRNQKIGFIFQSYNLLEDATLLENLLLPQRIGRQKPDVARALALLEEVGLKERAPLQARFLSGGEKQRAAIARALMNDPPLILADEPTGNLDHSHSTAIQTLLINAVKKRGKALILVTHDPEFAALCDRLLLLKDGTLYS